MMISPAGRRLKIIYPFVCFYFSLNNALTSAYTKCTTMHTTSSILPEIFFDLVFIYSVYYFIYFFGSSAKENTLVIFFNHQIKYNR